MKHKYKYRMRGKVIEREYTYIPIRYIIAILLTVLETLAILLTVAGGCYHIPYFYLAVLLTTYGCVLSIISSDHNPDYKIPWLLFVILVPIAGFMIYLMFYSRRLKPKFVRRLKQMYGMSYKRDDSEALAALDAEDKSAASQARMLTEIARTHIFVNTKQTYYSSGEDMHRAMLCDLESAEKFIYMEYFIIEGGEFWSSILEILRRKAAAGLDVKVLYDDIGCMSTLPGGYCRTLKKMGISALPFSRLRGNADSEFNNRSHRKITVIDGKIGYTGGVNLADEYINAKERFGHWKDSALRLEGEAVWELTKLFLTDFGINSRDIPDMPSEPYPRAEAEEQRGYVIPFGDGPRPIYNRYVGKSVIQNLLGAATEYMYMTTPYLIIDNDLCTSIENAALRGVDVRIILPHIPDKKLVFTMTKSYYNRLMAAGVKIYEYTPGFIHAKNYIADGKYAMTGTINLDYRSLVHHFENGVWMYGCSCIEDIKSDIDKTLGLSMEVTPEMLKTNALTKLIRALVRIFAPML